MKKYTVVYDDGFFRGSHYHSLIRYTYVETEDISKYLTEHFLSNVLFVFCGHCQIA